MEGDIFNVPIELTFRPLRCVTQARRTQGSEINKSASQKHHASAPSNDDTMCQTRHFITSVARNRDYNARERQGHRKLHRLRVLHLLEADFNLLIKILLARRFVWHCEDHQAFGEDQAGSRPGRSAIDVVLQKELTYDLTAQTLSNLAMMENNATSCFDRMMPSLVMVSLRAYGVPEQLTS
jgi:hypothetical protein